MQYISILLFIQIQLKYSQFMPNNSSGSLNPVIHFSPVHYSCNHSQPLLSPHHIKLQLQDQFPFFILKIREVNNGGILRFYLFQVTCLLFTRRIQPVFITSRSSARIKKATPERGGPMLNQHLF